MLVNNLAVSGGYQKLVIRLAEQLEQKGHKIVIYTPVLDRENCYPQNISKLNIVTINNGANKPMPERFSELAAKIEPSTEAMIIHDELSLIAIALLPKTNIQKIVWMLNNQYPENLGRYKSELLPILKATYVNKKDKRNDLVNNVKRIRLMKQGLKLVDRFAVYDSFNGELVQKHLHKPADFVAAGADLESFMPLYEKRSFKSKGSYTVLSVGVLFPHRRYEDLIKAIKLTDDAGYNIRATIVGRQDLSPDYYKSLTELTRELKIAKKITFLNYVTDREMIDLYAKSDAFAFINDGFTWGISVFESIAAGLPVIISSNIGAADLIKNNETGWVVPPRSPKKVAAAIEKICNEPKQAEKIANHAHLKLTDFVSWSNYADRMLKLLGANVR